MSLSSKVALITGGGKNLGAAIATLLAADGVNLALHYNSPSSQKATQSLAQSLSASHSTITVKTYQGDLTNHSNVISLFDAVTKDFNNKLDIVINTVGMVLKKPLTDISEAEYDTMFAINSKSAFFITQEAAKRVAEGGKIINTLTSLLAAYTGMYTSYQGSKAPVEWFTKGLSKELMPRGISVNAVAPGPMVRRHSKQPSLRHRIDLVLMLTTNVQQDTRKSSTHIPDPTILPPGDSITDKN